MILYTAESGINGKKFSRLTGNEIAAFRFSAAEQMAIHQLVKSLTFEVRATYCGARKCKGACASVYMYAQQYKAAYSPEHSKSIWFDDGSDDLQIALVFEEKSFALEFQTFLEQLYMNSLTVKLGGISVRDEVELVYVPNLKYVRLAHYEASDFDSPIQSLEELSAVQSVDSSLSVSNPLTQLQSIEHPELFNFHRPIKCHIKPRKSFSELSSNENNLLLMSRNFHDCFDGMMTQDHETGKVDIPMIAIKT